VRVLTFKDEHCQNRSEWFIIPGGGT
jgi:hypothetical protein